MSELLKNFGVDLPEEDQKALTKENKGGFWEFDEGEYKALVGPLQMAYKDAEGKKCEKDKPGAQLSHANFKIIMVADPKGVMIKDGKIPEDVEYGRMMWNQYVPLEDNKQWQNARFFGNFKLEDERLNIVQGEKNKEQIHLELLELWVGVPLNLKVARKKSAYIEEVTPLVKTITPEEYKKRKAKMDEIMSTLDKKLQEQQKDSNKSESQSEKPAEVDDPDNYLSDFSS